MVIPTRFGRRLPLPSTADVKHELRLMAAADAILASGALSPQEKDAMADELAARNGLSSDRVCMIIDRCSSTSSSTPQSSPTR